MTESNEQFLRTLADRHGAVKSAVKTLVHRAASDSSQALGTHAETLRSSCEDLESILSGIDQPKWLHQTIVRSRDFATSPRVDTGARLFDWLFENAIAINEPIAPSSVENVNFDEAYSDVRDALGLPELFDKLVDQLGAIIAEDLIESRTVLEALKQLKALLKSNRKGSQAAIFATLNYGKFVWLTCKGYLKKFGGPAIAAFEETYNDADERLKKVDERFRTDSLTKLASEPFVKRLARLESVDASQVSDFVPSGYLEGDIEDAEFEIKAPQEGPK